MKFNFTLSEFNISGEKIPEDVADKILEYHIIPMQIVRDKLGVSIWPSLKSGYRSSKWERKRGRSGKSQHCFRGKGAVDITCKDFSVTGVTLLDLIVEHTQYTRMAVYRSFIHCDYKPTKSGKRQIFKSDSSSKWTLTKEL